MTRRQEQKILATFSSAKGKTRLLRSFDPSSDHPDVQDPWEPVSEKMGKAYQVIYPVSERSRFAVQSKTSFNYCFYFVDFVNFLDIGNPVTFTRCLSRLGPYILTGKSRTLRPEPGLLLSNES
jgi:hypothetical protein